MITGSLQRFPPGHSAQEESSGDRQEESSGDKQKGECRRFPPGNGTRVQIIVRLEEDGQLLKRWSCVSRLTSQDENNVEIRPTLMQYLQDIAYEVMWVALERTEANSLENFKNFIEGVDHFRKYKDNRKHDDIIFKKAEELISEKVIKENEKFARAYFYLGNLYSWRASYAHKEEDYNKRDEYEEKSKKQYEQAGNGIAIKPSEAMAYKYFGTGLVDYRHYRNINDSDKMKDENKKLLETADQNFNKAVEEDEDFYFAKSGSALIYTDKAMLLKAHLKKLTEQKSNSDESTRESREKEAYLNESVKACLKKAITEFQSIREAAIRLNHRDNLKWIDKKILDLNLEMGTIHNMESRRPQLLSLFSGLFHAGSWCPDFNSSQSSTIFAEK
jgi:hypothetical protein